MGANHLLLLTTFFVESDWCTNLLTPWHTNQPDSMLSIGISDLEEGVRPEPMSLVMFGNNLVVLKLKRL